MLSPHIYYALLFFMSIYAFLRGRSDERIAAVTCILATFATNLVYWPRGSYVDVEIGVMLVDIGASSPSPSWRFDRIASGRCGSQDCS